MTEFVVTADGRQWLEVHTRESCLGHPCCVHAPSAHPLSERTLRWRPDRGIMERVCEHHVGHPDPDDVRVRLGLDSREHGCDGCCANPSDVVGYVGYVGYDGYDHRRAEESE